MAVLGNRIVASSSTGDPVILHGINRSGMEYTGSCGISWRNSEFDLLTNEWRVNLIRLPLNQEWVLGAHAGLYLSSIDAAVELAAARGAYTLLTLQWLDNYTVRGYDHHGHANYVAPLPDERSAAFWKTLAQRYSGRPEVLYDVLSEPHDRLPEDAVPEEPGFVSLAHSWAGWARRLTSAIREENPAALVFVSGINWGYDLSGFPIPELDAVVYSTHVYRNKGRNWDRAFGCLAASHCVFAGEWGGGERDVKWGAKLAAYLEGKGIGWAAWGWPDSPPLVDARWLPTAFGRLVRSVL